MKRNNMFMLSYTIFIFVAFIVKLCWNFPMWTPIVTAITVASCIFSCADIANIIAVEYTNDVKDFTPLLDDAIEKCEGIEKYYSKYEAQFASMSNFPNEMATILLECPDVVADAKQQLVKVIHRLSLENNLSKFCNWITNPLIMAGFLSFFCTITFEPISKMLVPVQDYLTVFAFGVMMSTQYFGNTIKEEHIELVENYREANSILDGIQKILLEASTLLEQEAATNAH